MRRAVVGGDRALGLLLLSEVRKTLIFGASSRVLWWGLGGSWERMRSRGRVPHCGRIPPPGRLVVVLVTGRQRPGPRSGRRSKLFAALRCVTFRGRLAGRISATRGRGVSRGFTVCAGLVGLGEPASR